MSPRFAAKAIDRRSALWIGSPRALRGQDASPGDKAESGKQAMRGEAAKPIAGFTLVELLVVIAIITVLISLLLPALNRAIDASYRINCASNLRQITTSLMMYASENEGNLMDASNFNGQWTPVKTSADYSLVPYTIHLSALAYLTSSYGMQRNLFYCPSNQTYNTDQNWNGQTITNFAVIGYSIVGGRQPLAAMTKIAEQSSDYGGFEEVTSTPTTDTTQLFLAKQGQNPFYTILAWDLTRGFNGLLTNSNHIVGAESPTGYLPTSLVGGSYGANEAFVDGHVEWRQALTLGQTATATLHKRQFFTGSYRFFF